MAGRHQFSATGCGRRVLASHLSFVVASVTAAVFWCSSECWATLFRGLGAFVVPPSVMVNLSITMQSASLWGRAQGHAQMSINGAQIPTEKTILLS